MTRHNDPMTAITPIRVRGWGMVPLSPNCTVLTVLDPDTGRYVSASVDEEWLDSSNPLHAEGLYDKLERELRWHQEHGSAPLTTTVDGVEWGTAAEIATTCAATGCGWNTGGTASGAPAPLCRAYGGPRGCLTDWLSTDPEDRESYAEHLRAGSV